MYYLDDDELRKLFCVYAQSDSEEYTDQFVDKVFSSLHENEIDEEDGKRFIDPNDPFNTMDNVTGIMGDQYIRFTDLAGDLLKELFADGVIDMLIVPEPLRASLLFGLVHFVWDIGRYRVPLNEGKKEFCKFLITHSYKFSDWVRYFPKGGRGFLLPQAIEDFCVYKLEKDPSQDKEQLRANAIDYANQLKDQHILVERNEPDRYIIRF